MIHNFGWFSKIIDKRFQNVIWVVKCSLEMSKYRLKISKTMTLSISIHRITIFYLMMIAMTRKMRSLFLVFLFTAEFHEFLKRCHCIEQLLTHAKCWTHKYAHKHSYILAHIWQVLCTPMWYCGSHLWGFFGVCHKNYQDCSFHISLRKQKCRMQQLCSWAPFPLENRWVFFGGGKDRKHSFWKGKNHHNPALKWLFNTCFRQNI